MTKPLTANELNGLTCGAPGCTHNDHESGMFLHSRCHPKAGTEVEYRNGVLYVRCNTCKKTTANIAVALGE